MTDADGTVQESYDRLATVYDRRWRHYVRETVREALQDLVLPSEGRLLDVGCGTGELLHALRARDPAAQLTGVDISAGMLRRARHKLGVEAALVQARANRLPFANATFATIVSTSTFHFFAKPERALAEMSRVLQPGGRLLISDWCHDYLRCRLLDRVLQRTDPAHRRAHTGAQLTGLIQRAGFESVTLRRYRIGWLWGMMISTAVRPRA